MHTRISDKGQVVLFGPLRRKPGLGLVDALDASVKSDTLAPRHRRPPKASIRRDSVTGLPILSGGSRPAQLTSEQVEDILSNLP
jgi:hypothetical protein